MEFTFSQLGLLIFQIWILGFASLDFKFSSIWILLFVGLDFMFWPLGLLVLRAWIFGLQTWTLYFYWLGLLVLSLEFIFSGAGTLCCVGEVAKTKSQNCTTGAFAIYFSKSAWTNFQTCCVRVPPQSNLVSHEKRNPIRISKVAQLGVKR